MNDLIADVVPDLDDFTAEELARREVSDADLRALFVATTKLIGRICAEVVRRGLWKAR